jgi:hypothetical protein
MESNSFLLAAFFFRIPPFLNKRNRHRIYNKNLSAPSYTGIEWKIADILSMSSLLPYTGDEFQLATFPFVIE